MRAIDKSSLYERDYHRWALEQAAKLRRGDPLDSENIAEELESLGRSQEQQLINRLVILIAHRLKWDWQPSGQSNSWRATIREQQKRIVRLIEKNPSLQSLITEAIPEAHDIAITLASHETGIVEEDFPQECPYSFDELMREIQ
ncbi:MAG: DUF29 domain-containing protein [Acidobacteriia bacterium]|nr:DUF29 domain-containing protein [Terriglobia bacterium]